MKEFLKILKARAARQAEYAANPMYLKEVKRPHSLKSGSKQSSVDTTTSAGDTVQLDLQTPLEIPGMVGLDRYMEQQQKTMSWKDAKKPTSGKKGKKKRSSQAHQESDEELPVVHEVNR